MIRTKGEPGTGDIVQAVSHMRKMNRQIAQITSMREDELFDEAKSFRYLTTSSYMSTTTAVFRSSILLPAALPHRWMPR